MADDVFHEGELAVQAIAGECEMAERNGRLFGTTILIPALPFLARQPLFAAAAVDEAGQLWCSVWCGTPGFVTSADGSAVTIVRSLDDTPADDPVRRLMRPGAELGLLAIELGTRKRLRINGTVVRANDDELHIAVRESFPNCPKYIQKRRLLDRGSATAAPFHESGTRLDERRVAFVQRADTMFVGSGHPTRGPDASHRGGTPGFLRVLDEHTIRVPDYPGNSMFLTLGNLHVEPRAGVVLVDFERSELLAMTGATVVRYGADDPAHPSGGTGRYWDFTVTRWLELCLPGSFDWELVERSPLNPPAAAREV